MNSTSSEFVPLGFKVAFSTIFVIYISLGTVGNVLILVVIGCRKELHSVPYAFIANLAVADLLVCGLFLPIYTGLFLQGRVLQVDDPLCSMEAFLNVLSNGGALLTILLIAINRLMTVSRGIQRNLLRGKTAVAAITVVWLYSFTFAVQLPLRSVPLAYLDDLSCGPGTLPVQVTFYTCILAVPITITIGCYIAIYFYLKKRRHILPVRLAADRARIVAARHLDDSTVFKAILAVSCLYGVCFPLHLLCSFVIAPLVPSQHYPVVHLAGYCILFFTNATNFFIYLARNPTFRRASWALLLRGRHPATDRTVELPLPTLSKRIVSHQWL